MHFYVFTERGWGYPVYERTCGTLKAAQREIADFRRRGLHAFVSVDSVPKDFFY